jgi:DNA-binding IclR family transcriptional regulator
VAGDGSILKLSDLVSNIQQARELGYGLVEGSMDPMIGAVSVPVRNPSGHCLAALSVVLPSVLIKADLQALLQPLQRTASELQSQLRLRDWPLGEAGFASLRMAR